jgi:hypothetical protein
VKITFHLHGFNKLEWEAPDGWSFAGMILEIRANGYFVFLPQGIYIPATEIVAITTEGMEDVRFTSKRAQNNLS